MYHLDPAVVFVVVLLPGVNLYPPLLLCPLLPRSSVVLCARAGGRACVWVVYPPGVLALVCLSGCLLRASVSVLASVAPLCLFSMVFTRVFGWPGVCLCLVVPLASSHAVWSVGSVSPFSLLSFFRPRAALPVGIPWALGETNIDLFNS